MNGEAMRALSDNRELAFLQSALTACGYVPPMSAVREYFSDRLAESVGIFSPSLPGATRQSCNAGQASYQPDPPAWDEVVTDYAARRGE